ncbi:unnamed protein product, partial [marine sediment metagenome]
MNENTKIFLAMLVSITVSYGLIASRWDPRLWVEIGRQLI